LVVHWLTDCDTWDWFPPPLTVDTIKAIYRRLEAAAH